MKEQDKEKAVAKMRKVLALLEGAKTEGEAKAANLKLQQLLAKYHMSISEIEMACAEDSKPEVDEVAVKVGAGSETKWKNHLATVIAKNYRCDTFLRRSLCNGKETWRYVMFVGEGGDAELAKRVFTVTVEVAQRLYRTWCAETRESRNAKTMKQLMQNGFSMSQAERYTRGASGIWSWKPSASERNGWYRGFVKGLEQAYNEQMSADNELALALVVPASVKEHMAAMVFSTTRHSKGQVLDGAAYNAGKETGHGYGSGDRLTA